MFKIVKSSYFTLLELLIVLFIISFGVLLTGVKLKEAYEEQRFFSEAQQVLSHIAMAQDLMLIMDADVQVKLAHDPETRQVTCRLEIEKPLEDAWARMIERNLILTAIHSFEFEKGGENPLTLNFTLGCMSQGTLTLFEGKQDDARRSEKRLFKIELAGYPSPMGAKLAPFKNNQNQVEQSQLLYPIEVYEKLYPDPGKKNP